VAVHARAHTHTHTHTHTRTHTHTHTHTYTHIHKHTLKTYTSRYTQTHTNTQTHAPQVLQQGHLACTALQLFCHAWGLLPPNATAPPSLGPSGRRSADVSSSQSGPSIDTNSSSKDDSKVIGQGSSNGSNISRTFPSRTAAGEDPGFHKQGAWAPAGSGPRYPAPLAFIQDHQSKEVALDALLGLVGCPGALGTLVCGCGCGRGCGGGGGGGGVVCVCGRECGWVCYVLRVGFGYG